MNDLAGILAKHFGIKTQESDGFAAFLVTQLRSPNSTCQLDFNFLLSDRPSLALSSNVMQRLHIDPLDKRRWRLRCLSIRPKSRYHMAHAASLRPDPTILSTTHACMVDGDIHKRCLGMLWGEKKKMLILTGSRQLNKVDQWRLMNYGCLVVSQAPRIGVISNDLRRIQPGAASAQEGRWINTTLRVYISLGISLCNSHLSVLC